MEADPQGRLREHLTARDTFAYGFALVRRSGEPGEPYGQHLGIVTPRGRSMPLTGTLANRLIYYLAWIEGLVAVSFTEREGGRTGKPPSDPLQELDAEFAAGPTVAGNEHRAVRIKCIIRPSDLEAPLICLLQKMPPGWPP